MEERVVELESRFMEQQSVIEDLSDVVYAQQKVIDSLLARVDQLEKKLAEQHGVVEAPADEVPPHY